MKRKEKSANKWERTEGSANGGEKRKRKRNRNKNGEHRRRVRQSEKRKLER